MRPKKARPLNKDGFPYEPARLIKADGKWYITYMVWDHNKKKLITKKLYRIEGDTPDQMRRDADEKVYQINQLLKEGYAIARKQTSSQEFITIKAGFEKAYQAKLSHISPKTKESYDSHHRWLTAWLAESGIGDRRLQSLGKGDILAFLDWLYEKRKLGNRSRNNYRMYVTTCLEELVKREYIKVNPAKGIKDLPTKSTSHIPFTPEEQEILEKWLKQHNKQLYYFTRFIYYAFIRRIELCRLKVNHVDLKNRVILVRSMNAKNKKQMPVEIVDPLAEVIEEMELSKYPGNHLIFSKKLLPGTDPIWPNRVSEAHKRALEATNLYNGELTMYSWKHTGNCNAYRAGADIIWIQHQNRHYSLQETEIYLRSMGFDGGNFGTRH
ncbi:MAG: tyrosine-type recombinase/integrase, partial [Bacteroidota bacterium]